jgi:hypothetical protein
MGRKTHSERGYFSILAEAEGPEPTEKRQYAAAVFRRPTAGRNPLAVWPDRANSAARFEVAPCEARAWAYSRDRFSPIDNKPGSSYTA